MWASSFNVDFNGGSKMGFKEYSDSDGTLREGFKIFGCWILGAFKIRKRLSSNFHVSTLQGFKNFGAVCFS